jgi:hypothetical protein
MSHDDKNCRYTDCCKHGVPFRWPEECIECEMEEVETPEAA